MNAFLFLISLPQVMGPNLKPYGPFKKGDIVLDINIPKEIAEVLRAQEAVLELSLEDALLLNTIRDDFRDNYVIESATVLRIDLTRDIREYMTFKTLEDAKEYLDSMVKKYKEKGLLVNDIEFNSYQIGKVMYVLTAKVTRITGINPEDIRQCVTA